MEEQDNKIKTDAEVIDSEYVDLIILSRYEVQSQVSVKKVINYRIGSS
jgi:hypothetical protein